MGGVGAQPGGSPLRGEVGPRALTDTHTEVVGIVEMPETQDQLLILPTGALGGQRARISWPQGLAQKEQTFLPPALASSNLLVPLRHRGF